MRIRKVGVILSLAVLALWAVSLILLVTASASDRHQFESSRVLVEAKFGEQYAPHVVSQTSDGYLKNLGLKQVKSVNSARGRVSYWRSKEYCTFSLLAINESFVQLEVRDRLRETTVSWYVAHGFRWIGTP